MKINIQKVIDFWIKNAELKWETAKTLKRANKNSDCLFFCHLVLECLLKAHVCQKTKTQAPYTHYLTQLAELAELELNKTQKGLLKTATTFNLKARYDDYKLAFYKKVNKNYADKYFKESNKMRLWLLKKLQNQRQSNL